MSRYDKPPKPRAPHTVFPPLAPRSLFTHSKPPVVVRKKRPARGAPKKPKLGLNP